MVEASVPGFDKMLVELNDTKTVAWWKLNWTAKLNIVNYEIVCYLSDFVEHYSFAPEDAPRVVIVRGEGGKAFCAGGDVVSIYNAKVKKENEEILDKYFVKEFELDFAIS